MERIGEDLHGPQQQVAEVPAGLAGARAVEAPLRDVLDLFDRRVEDFRFRAQLRGRSLSIDPNVFSGDLCHGALPPEGRVEDARR
jgi:hypothetical protein